MTHVGGQPPVGQGIEMLQEHWLRHFCEREEFDQLLLWLQQEGLARPRLADDRIAHAEYLRTLSNDWYGKSDYRRALHCIMGAVHALDFSPNEQLGQDEDQKRRASKGMLPVMSNAAMIFLKRGDAMNGHKAASAGLRCASKLPDGETAALRAKLLFRRALAQGEEGPQKDLEAARADLTEALKLEPANQDVRACLENCTRLWREERKADPLRYKPPAAARPAGQAGGAEATEGDAPSGAAEVGEEAAPRPQLSPAAEKLAECVGRCLGRSRRYMRTARSTFLWIRGRNRDASDLQLLVTLPVMVLVFAVACRNMMVLDGWG